MIALLLGGLDFRKAKVVNGDPRLQVAFEFLGVAFNVGGRQVPHKGCKAVRFGFISEHFDSICTPKQTSPTTTLFGVSLVILQFFRSLDSSLADAFDSGLCNLLHQIGFMSMGIASELTSCISWTSDFSNPALSKKAKLSSSFRWN